MKINPLFLFLVKETPVRKFCFSERRFNLFLTPQAGQKQIYYFYASSLQTNQSGDLARLLRAMTRTTVKWL